MISELRRWIAWSALLFCGISPADSQQTSIPRIDLMPNSPSPYFMRDWRSVARGYDSLVFDFSRTGTYLPLVWLNTNPVNYPSHNSFGLHTVVGTTAPASAEAINCIPAVVGASLAGIDMGNHMGRNWALMSEEWFNNRPEQNVYKNHPVDDTGDDWWYETMPNVFFYQLNYLYPGTGHFDYQFTKIADRWLEALQAMGASRTPWSIPNMDHRGWYLQTMTPYDNSVHEPEAAGAIGWLLYNAWRRTGNVTYRAGAEGAMEFLSGRSSNPAYELQLSYGAYTAARMNAELGTNYDVNKMLNWCFNVGPLRSWGAMTAKWGSYDCAGLIGEVNGINDYAFAMNTFEQIGALVPMVRYDDRYARAIGKWVLNAANAARLFYVNFLPDGNQDSEQWGRQYDSSSVIAHEAMRQFNGATSPYATGDAISGGWGQTNLALYGSSHVGILGGIIDTTNVPKILKLDLLKTDYYHDSSYPSFLYYNPYDSAKIVEIDAGSGMHDLYDGVSNLIIASGVTGTTSFPIAANSAVSIVILPAGGTTEYVLDKMLVNGVVVDYHSTAVVDHYPPRIKSLAATTAALLAHDSARVYCTAMDLSGDTLSYLWQATGGKVVGSGPAVKWTSDSLGTYIIRCIVTGLGGSDTATITLSAVAFIDKPPVIVSMSAKPRKLDLNAQSTITVAATDPDSGDTLHYTWSATGGLVSQDGSTMQWTAPAIVGDYLVRCVVDDGRGGLASDSIALEVRDFSQSQAGSLIAYFPFSGNAVDSSGNGNNGTLHGASPAADRFGTPNSAYAFNGTTAYIQVPSTPGLNVQHAISINFWLNVGAFFVREQYPISHGNWPNRWKISITNNGIRWTIRTSAGIKDLNSETKLNLHAWYNVTAVYDSAYVEVYINGNLDAFAPWSGAILTTPIDLTIGQVLPNDQGYNFQGSIDDIRMYDYGLSVREIDSLAGVVTDVKGAPPKLPSEFSLTQNFPNPFNPETRLRFAIAGASQEEGRPMVTLRIYDLLGREIATLVNERLSPGYYERTWNASAYSSGIYIARLTAESYQTTKKLLLIR